MRNVERNRIAYVSNRNGKVQSVILRPRGSENSICPITEKFMEHRTIQRAIRKRAERAPGHRNFGDRTGRKFRQR